MGFFKRQDSKLEPKKDATVDEPVASPTATDIGAIAESPATAATTTETKPALKEKRRTSLFNGLGSKKEKSDTETTEGESRKSPLPQKLGGLFRRPSKAVKSEETKNEPVSSATAAAPVAAATEPAMINGVSDVPKESASQTPAVVTSATPEVKASV